MARFAPATSFDRNHVSWLNLNYLVSLVFLVYHYSAEQLYFGPVVVGELDFAVD